MVACKVLSPFTEYVPATGMVVGNANATVELPVRFARVRRERGFVDYKDTDAEEEAGFDAARPRSRLEKRLLARAQRRAQKAAQAAEPGTAPLRETPPPSRVGEAAPQAAAKPRTRANAKAPANPELAAARADYRELTGKNPSPRLDVAGIRAKLAELTAGGPAVAATAPRQSGAKGAAKAKAAAAKSDAPVD